MLLRWLTRRTINGKTLPLVDLIVWKACNQLESRCFSLVNRRDGGSSSLDQKDNHRENTAPRIRWPMRAYPFLNCGSDILQPIKTRSRLISVRQQIRSHWSIAEAVLHRWSARNTTNENAHTRSPIGYEQYQRRYFVVGWPDGRPMRIHCWLIVGPISLNQTGTRCGLIV